MTTVDCQRVPLAQASVKTGGLFPPYCYYYNKATRVTHISTSFDYSSKCLDVQNQIVERGGAVKNK
jgi:hypothetical protein